MGKNQSASGLTNIIQYDNRGNISFVSGSTTLMQVSSSGAITTTGVISGSSAQSASLAQNSNLLQGTGSVGFATTASFTTASGSISTRVTQIEQVYATTGSNSFRATQSITGSLTVTGQIVAQTLNVQQVTSSIVFSSGSNTFGCDLNSRQTFTGSVIVTGSLIVNTTGTELQVNNNGVILGNLLTDNHNITGSLRVTGSVASFSNCVSIGLGNFAASGALDIRNTIQPNKQITLNTSCGFGTYVNLSTDSESFYSWTNSSAATNNRSWRMGTPTATPNVLTIQNMTDSGASICGTPMTISACGRVTVCTILGATSIDLNPVAACPSNAGAAYGMFGYSGVGLGLSSAGTGANQGIGFFTCGDFERMRLISSGNLGIGTICPSSRLTVAGDVGIGSNIGSSTYTGPSQYGAITFPRAQILFSNTNGQNQFYFISNGTLNSSSQYIYTCNGPAGGMIYDNGSLALSVVDCGASGGVITFRTGVGVTAGGCVNTGPTVTVGNQGGSDTTFIGGGSGVGSIINMRFATGAINNQLLGNGDNFFNCVTGRLNANGGVKFGGGATTLNNYEQGSWTPALQNATVSYSDRSGTYVRIGDYVFVRWGFRISSISGQSGTVTISGLPFTSVSWGSYQEPNISVSTGTLATADNAHRARIFVGGSSTSLIGRIANNSDTSWLTSELQNGAWIIGEIFYNIP